MSWRWFTIVLKYSNYLEVIPTKLFVIYIILWRVSYQQSICLKGQNMIVRRVSHWQFIYLEGQDNKQLLSGRYPTSKPSVLRARISYNYCPDPISKLSVLRIKISNNYCLEGSYSTSNLLVLRVKIPKSWKGHIKLDYCLASTHINTK